jgi:hypothetical protein
VVLRLLLLLWLFARAQGQVGGLEGQSRLACTFPS